ncbi:MAG: YqiA/YcfP family alpha/beta fold hydrolase [Burkholderiales bacterium]
MIIYAHGFNSSPASYKSNLLRERLAELMREDEFACPALSYEPAKAIARLELEINSAGPERTTVIGSSLGGFYATWLCEKYGCRSVLVNPAIRPQTGLRAYLGAQQNLYSGENYTLTEEHLAHLAAIYLPNLKQHPRYLLLQSTGDEVLDWREAVSRYAGCRQIIVNGSDHGFSEFRDYLDVVLAFAE